MMRKLFEWLGTLIVGIVAYWKGGYDQEQRGKEAAQQEVKKDEQVRNDIETRLDTASDAERERVQSKWDRD